MLASRLCDGLDGALARLTAPTDRGAFLDITLDFLFYASIPLAFAFADPGRQRAGRGVLLAAFIGTATTFLAFAALAAQRGLASLAYPDKGIYYLGGLTEATETLGCFALMCLWPMHFALFAWVFAALCALTIVTRCGPAGAPSPDPAVKRCAQEARLLIVAGLAGRAFFAFDLGRYLSLDYIKQRQADFARLYGARPAS
jgi:phosphatidylglycerophosphate synthase